MELLFDGDRVLGKMKKVWGWMVEMVARQLECA